MKLESDQAQNVSGEINRTMTNVSESVAAQAEDTAEGAKEVDGLDENITNNMEGSFREQENSVEVTEEKFRAIESGLKDIQDSVNVLNASGKNMMSSKEVIVNMIQNLSAAAQENAANSEEVMASVEIQNSSLQKLADMSKDLAVIAANLKAQAAHFNV